MGEWGVVKNWRRGALLCALLAAVSHGALVQAAEKKPAELPSEKKAVGLTSFNFGDTLVDAADQGNASAVKSMVSSGKAVDSKGRFDATPLMRASFKGHGDIVKYLISVGANINARDVGGATALHMAARRGNDEVVKQLLAAGANTNQTDHEGWTPLMRAALQGHTKVVELLVKGGANVNAANTQSETALMMAAFTGNAEITKILVQNGAQKGMTDSNGLTAAEIAFQRGYTGVQEALADQSTHGTLQDAPVKAAENGVSKPRATDNGTNARGIDAMNNGNGGDIRAKLDDRDSGTNAVGIGANGSASGDIRTKLDDPDAGTNAVGVGQTSLQKDVSGIFDSGSADAPGMKKPVDLGGEETRKPWTDLDSDKGSTPKTSGLFDDENPSLKNASDVPALKMSKASTAGASGASMPASLDDGGDKVGGGMLNFGQAPIKGGESTPEKDKKSKKDAKAKPELASSSGFLDAPATSDKAPAAAVKPAEGKLQYLVQLGTTDSATDAARYWNRIKKEYPDELGRLTPVMSQVTLRAEQRDVYRTQAGYFDKKTDAEKLCDKLSAHNMDCFVVEVSARDVSGIPMANAGADSDAPARPVEDAAKKLDFPPEDKPVVANLTGGKGSTGDKAALDKALDSDPQTNKATFASSEELAANKPKVTRMFSEAKPDKDEAKPMELAAKGAEPSDNAAITRLDESTAPKLPSVAEVKADRFTPLPENLDEPASAEKSKPAKKDLTPVSDRFAPSSPKVVAIPKQDTPSFPHPGPAMTTWSEAEKPAPAAAPVDTEPKQAGKPMELADLPPDSTFSSDVAPNDAEPYAAATPMTEDGKPKEGFSVGEAVRVPLEETAPATMAEATPIAPNLLPSRSSKQVTEWLRMGPFESSDKAKEFWNKAAKEQTKLISGLRFRVTEPFNQRSGKVSAWAEVGPVAQQETADKLCEYAVDNELECKMREDLGLSMASTNKRGDATPRATDAKLGMTGGTHPVVMLPPASDKEPPAYWVQLGSFSSKQDAEQHWGGVLNQAQDVLGSYTAYAMPPRYSSSKDPVLRLRLGPFYQQKDALELCGQLRYRNIRCLSLLGT
ncbi:hypothetical protein GC177_05470 [bacterium]|nr:hypothetical protein [bacterium]